MGEGAVQAGVAVGAVARVIAAAGVGPEAVHVRRIPHVRLFLRFRPGEQQGR